MSQRREYYRVEYPIEQRPLLVVGSTQVEILELSENGARIALESQEQFVGSDSFDATIRFKDGTAANVTATLQRREADQAILRFSDNLPYSIIASEQRRLLQLFPREAAKARSAAL